MSVAITAIYLSKQGVSNIGYLEHKCLSFYIHSCCKYSIISFVRFRYQWFQVVKYAINVVIYCSLWLLEAEH